MKNSQFNKRWHSPVNVYMHLNRLAKKVGQPTLESSPLWKRAREARIAAVMAFVVTKIRNIPTVIRLPLNDPPDAYLMQPNGVDMDITTVELTSYRNGAKETLLDQLARTKIKKYKTLSSKYVLGVDLLTEEGVDYQAINDYAVSVKAPFPVWTFLKIQDYPDTIAEIVITNPKISKFMVNVGEEAFYFSDKYKIPHVVFSKKAHKPEEVRSEPLSEECNIAPWEDLED